MSEVKPRFGAARAAMSSGVATAMRWDLRPSGRSRCCCCCCCSRPPAPSVPALPPCSAPFATSTPAPNPAVAAAAAAPPADSYPHAKQQRVNVLGGALSLFEPHLQRRHHPLQVHDAERLLDLHPDLLHPEIKHGDEKQSRHRGESRELIRQGKREQAQPYHEKPGRVAGVAERYRRGGEHVALPCCARESGEALHESAQRRHAHALLVPEVPRRPVQHLQRVAWHVDAPGHIERLRGAQHALEIWRYSTASHTRLCSCSCSCSCSRPRLRTRRRSRFYLKPSCSRAPVGRHPTSCFGYSRTATATTATPAAVYVREPVAGAKNTARAGSHECHIVAVAVAVAVAGVAGAFAGVAAAVFECGQRMIFIFQRDGICKQVPAKKPAQLRVLAAPERDVPCLHRP
mmetsp:Transcript_4474/g.10983  ORF Transcript_4474/g.10983 Transcript_4474/m.10983 type:complete len:402 (+) Transcript_4474:318-1523(+)